MHGVGFRGFLASPSSTSLIFQDSMSVVDARSKACTLLNKLIGNQVATSGATMITRSDFRAEHVSTGSVSAPSHINLSTFHASQSLPDLCSSIASRCSMNQIQERAPLVYGTTIVLIFDLDMIPNQETDLIQEDIVSKETIMMRINADYVDIRRLSKGKCSQSYT